MRDQSNKQVKQWFAPFQATRFYKAAERALQSVWFPVALAALVLLSNVFGLDVAAFGLIVALFCFINLFLRDVRPAIPIVLLSVFCVSMVHSPGYGDGGDFYTTPSVLAVLTVYAVLAAGSIVFHLFYYGQWKRMFQKRKLLTGLIVLSVAGFLGGVFSARYDAQNLVLAAMQLFSLLIIYLYFSAAYEWRKTDTVYLARICALAGAVIALQVLHLYVRQYTVGTPLDGLWKAQIIIGWGVSNSVGLMLVIVLPMYFYLMQADKKRGWLYYAAAIGVMVAIFFTLCRTALLIGVPVLILGMAVSCVLKGNRSVYIVMTAAIGAVAVGITVFLLRSEVGEDILAFFKEVSFDDRGRFDLWKKDIDYFLQSPLFGEGFAALYHDYGGALPIMQTLSHNTILNMLGKCGLVGLCAYLFHSWQAVKLFVTKPDLTRTFLAAGVLCFIASGMLDNMFFYVYPTFFYMFYLMFAENLLRDKQEG